MGDYGAVVETNTSDVLAVLDSEGFMRGKGLLNFQGPLDVFCMGVEWEEKDLSLEETYYYYPDVVVDFESLYATLELLKSRRVKKVRINIE